MSSIFDYIENNPKETQRVIGLKYEQLKQLLQKAIELHRQKQEMESAVLKQY